jgi:hypothetical protein
MLNQKFIRQIVFFTLLCFLATILACLPLGLLFPAETRAPETFPEADIVFVSNKGLGFVNADGSNLTYVPLTVKDINGKRSQWWRPVITGDSRTLIVKVRDERFDVYNPTLLSIWGSGEFPMLCKQWGLQQTAYLSANQQYIFISTEQEIALYNLDDCGADDAYPAIIYEGVLGIFSPDIKHSVYVKRLSPIPADDRFVILRDMDSGEERTVGVGAYPAWSRDSQWLAYTGKDGIYVVNVLTQLEPQRAVLYTNPYAFKDDPTYSAGAYWRISPEASWSPDGKWLVYHRWTGTDYYTGTNPDYNAIYILNLETGEETKILDGGMYPYWRWPATEE